METGGSSESPIEPKKGKSKTSTKPKESILKQKSPAEFFAENKNIAGFDNPGKCLYTTVRELVENSLDSAESISELPMVEITIEEIERSKFNSMIGLVDRERVDEELYDDFETVKAREKRLAKEARYQEMQAKNSSLGKKGKDPPAPKGIKGRGEASFYRVTCKDNGRGMPHDDIPNMFGRVLSGTKYGLKQTRGKFGLGAKMALIWSKMSTGLPIEILSSMRGQSYTSFCRLDIDIQRNIPHIHAHEKQENKDQWQGAKIQVVIEGNWTTYRSKILHYMRQMAVITPYAQFLFKFLSDSPDKNVTIRFARRTDVMPPVPQETKHHPSSVDLLLIKRLITETSKQTLLQFLQHEYVNIGKAYAERLIGKFLMDAYPTLYWTPYAAHCLDLMLEDLGKLEKIKKTITRAIRISGYIYTHGRLLSLMREYTGNKNLHRPAKTRFTTSFISLSSLHRNKNGLRKVFTLEEWTSSKWSKEPKGRRVEQFVMNVTFWKHIVYCLKVSGPLVKVLRLVDGERKPPMGYIYEAMDKAKQAISKSLNEKEEDYQPIWDIIDRRWNVQLHQPLHAAAHYLNPGIYYARQEGNNDCDRDSEVMEGLYKCIAKFYPREQDQDQITEELPMYKHADGLFGNPLAKRQRNKKSPGEMGPDFNLKLPIKSLTSQQIVRIHQLFRQAKFDDPSGDCLSPAGEYNLRLGIIKELHPDMVATYSGSAHVFEGHPFIVEAGVSVGGKDVKQGLNIFRFANRIPLLFEQGADVVTRTALKRINWNSYKINQTQDKIGVFVSIVSTKIPFKGTGKEYIGDDIKEIASAVKASIQQCCIQLKTKILKRIQAREQQERKRNLSKYVPDATGAIYDVLKEMARLHASKKKRYSNEDTEILNKVSDGLITKETLREKLAQHVEQVDYEMALEYATQSGVSEEPREAIYIHSREAKINIIDFHSPVFVFRLIQ